MIKQKRILLVSPFFYPEPISTGKFNTALAKALRDNNYYVTVLCSHPFYPKWIPKVSNKNIEKINIIRGGAYIKYPKKTLLKRFLLEVWFALFVLKNVLGIRKKIDFIVPVFPPSFYFYFLTSVLKKGTKTIGIVHDLQEVYANNNHGGMNKIIRILINKIEGKALRSCDKLIFLSEEMKKTAKIYYNLEEDKMEVKYPFVNLNITKTTNDLDGILSKNKKHVVYSGALGIKQNPNKVYEFYEYASKNITNTEFHFFSQGDIYEKLKRKNTNDNIRFHDLVPEKNILELYKKSTVQIIPQLPGTSKGSLPSKLPNLLISGCKLLVITDENSEIHKLFNKYDLKSVVTLWDNNVLCTKLVELIQDNDKVCSNNVQIAKELFQLNHLVDKIIK
jgi:glycosyltransferase involved in cell wall biosynthesis